MMKPEKKNPNKKNNAPIQNPPAEVQKKIDQPQSNPPSEGCGCGGSERANVVRRVINSKRKG